MTFEELQQITDEVEQIQKTYEIFREDTRLSWSKAAQVEFLTTTRIIEQYLKPGAQILDVGAGAGAYSLYFDRKGYEVCALELAENNIRAFREKLTPQDKVELVQGNAVDLSRYADGSFDAVLLFGPLYHLHREDDRQKEVCCDRRDAEHTAYVGVVGGVVVLGVIPQLLLLSVLAAVEALRLKPGKIGHIFSFLDQNQ